LARTNKGDTVARITFQKRQKEMKRKEKRQLKAEKRAQRKIAKSTESEAAAESFAPDVYQPEDSVAPMHEYVEANGIEKQMQVHTRETAGERWTEGEGQRDGTRKASS
jgi:acetyl-CoA carboxylase carboxyltransferase component